NEDAARQGFRSGRAHRIAGAAQLEGADRLEVLELEPDLGGRIHVKSQQGCAHDETHEPLACRLDLPQPRRFERPARRAHAEWTGRGSPNAKLAPRPSARAFPSTW